MKKLLITASLIIGAMHANALQTYDWSVTWTSGWLAGTVESGSYTFDEVGKTAWTPLPGLFTYNGYREFDGSAIVSARHCENTIYCQLDMQPYGMVSTTWQFELGRTGFSSAVRNVPSPVVIDCYPSCITEWSSGTTTWELRGAPAVSPIPEPSTYLLTALGIAGVSFARRRFSASS